VGNTCQALLIRSLSRVWVTPEGKMQRLCGVKINGSINTHVSKKLKNALDDLEGKN